MKVFLWILLLSAVLFGFAGTTYADCPDWVAGCYTRAGKGYMAGKVSVGRCWKWSAFGCVLCHNNEASNRCNDIYSQCQGNCWACEIYGVLGKGDCMDKDGNCHGQCPD